MVETLLVKTTIINAKFAIEKFGRTNNFRINKN